MTTEVGSVPKMTMILIPNIDIFLQVQVYCFYGNMNLTIVVMTCHVSLKPLSTKENCIINPFQEWK